MSLSLWHPTILSEGPALPWICGPLRLLRKREGDDCLLGIEREATAGFPVEPSAKPNWQRFCGLSNWTHMDAEPRMPDRPLVVRPLEALVIPSGTEARLFLAFPLTAQINVGSKPTDNSLADKRLLTMIPTQSLSDTWFGDTVQGELSYSLKIPARRDCSLLPSEPHLVRCPFIVRNKDSVPLLLERICLRGQFLRIFQGDQHLWTPAVTLEQSDRSGLCLVTYEVDAPLEAGKSPVLLTEHQEKPHKGGLIRRTFGGAATLFLDSSQMS